MIPTITLWQPHASLIFSGHKRYETRSWPCPKKYIGQRIAIHAGANQTDMNELFRACKGTRKRNWYDYQDLAHFIEPFGDGGLENPDKYGDFSFGRFAWKLTDAELFKEPIPAKGAQGFWNWEQPENAK